MKTAMSSRERMLSALRRQAVDHIPLGQLFHSTIMETPKEMLWTNQFERARLMKSLGLDPVIDIWLPAPEPPPDIQVRKWKEQNTEGPDLFLCAEYDTPKGKLIQKVRQTPDWYHSTHYNFLPRWDGNAHRSKDRFDAIDLMDDWFTRRYQVPLVNGPEDLDAFECLLQPPRGKQRNEWITNALKARKYAEEMDLLTVARRVSIGDWFMWVCLIEPFCEAMVEQPEYVSRFYDIVTRYSRAIIDMVLEVQPDVIVYRGWYDTPDYWGRQRFQNVLLPRIQPLGKQIHDGGSLFCYLLTEGYTHYSDLLPKTGADVFLGLEPLAARKSENLGKVKTALRDHSSIWGGVNACVTVGMGSDEEINQAVRTAVDALGPDGFILNASIYLYDDDVRWDRFMTFVNAWRQCA